MSKRKLREQYLTIAKENNERIIADYQKRTGHRRPRTRREFLGSGLLSFSAALYGPTLMGLNYAYAEECPTPDPENRLVPFININLHGGAAIAGNVIPMDAGGQLLGSYSKIGMGKVPAVQSAFANGLKFHNNASPNANFNGSGLLAGIKSAASADTLSKAVAIYICSASGDDSDKNKMNIAGLVTKAGLSGSILSVLGSVNSKTGLKQSPAFGITPPTPLVVRTPESVLKSVTYGNDFNRLSLDERIKVTELIKELSMEQSRNMAGFSGGENAQHIVKCSMERNIDNLSSGADLIDPKKMIGLDSVWNFNDKMEAASATIVGNALKGLAGAAGIEAGSFDYHGGERTDTDQLDFGAGVVIGKTLQSAAVLNEKVFIHVTSDGSCGSEVSDAGGAKFISDRGSSGSHIIIMFDPSGAPSVKSSQLGYFTAGQVAEKTSLVGGSAESAAAAAFVNWAKFSGKASVIDTVLPNLFTPANLNELIVV